MKIHMQYLCTDWKILKVSFKINNTGTEHGIFLMTGAWDLGELMVIVVTLF